MEKHFSLILGSALGLLALSGFVKRQKPKHLLGHMNVDTQHSVLRVPLTGALLYASSNNTPLKNTRSVLSFVSAVYFAIGISGMFTKSLGGKLPSKLTNFDLVYHYIVGILALWLGGRSGRMVKP